MGRPAGPERAAIYVRVSSRDQAEGGTSLETQEAACRRHAAGRGYAVDETHVHRETHSGTELWERPKLTALRAAVRAREVDVVLAHAIDRLARDPVHLGVVISEADYAGVRVEFVTEPLDGSPEGQLIQYVRGYAAKLEREKIRERTQRGKLARVEAGKLPALPRAPYGYRFADATKARLVPDPATALVVQRIFAEAAAGTSVRAIAERLAADAVPAPHTARRWWPSTVAVLLRHPAYQGTAAAWRQESRKERGTRVVRRRPPEEWTLLPAGTAPALVSPAEWQAARARLALNRQAARRNAALPERYLLRGGLARCAACGGPLHGVSTSQTAADGTPHRYYRCGSRGDGRGRPRHAPCPASASIAVAELDLAAWGAVLRRAWARRTPPQPKAAAQRATQRTALEREHRDLERRQRLLGVLIGKAESEAEADPLVAENKRLAARRQAVADGLAALAADREASEEAWAQLTAAAREASAALASLRALRPPQDLAAMRPWVERLGLRVVVRPRGDPFPGGARYRFEWRA